MWDDDQITPTGNGVLLKKYTLPEKETLVTIPDSAKTQLATVLAVGPGKMNDKTGVRHEFTVKVGDIVTLDQFPGGMVYGWGDDERLIVDEASVSAVVEL